MRTLAFVGCNIGGDVTRAVSEHDVCLLFEPIPDVAEALVNQFNRPEYRNKSISVINAACWTDYKKRPFYLYNKLNGASSSLGKITQQAIDYYSPEYDLQLIGEIEVQCVKLADFLPFYLDTLIVDAQGADLTILKSIEPWLLDRRIKNIQAEYDHHGFQHYHGLENSESAIESYFKEVGLRSYSKTGMTK